MDPRNLSRAVRRALIVTAAVSGAIEMLAAAITGSRILLAVGTIEIAFACILAAIETLLRRDGRQIPLDDDHQHDT